MSRDSLYCGKVNSCLYQFCDARMTHDVRGDLGGVQLGPDIASHPVKLIDALQSAKSAPTFYD